MTRYIDLHPAPQFDASLVTYCVINFNRMREALLTAPKRVASEFFTTVGPWNKYIYVNAPFKCDVVLWVELSWFVVSVGQTGMGLIWDGVGLPYIMDMWWNEAYSHKDQSVTNTIRNVAKGQHEIRQYYVTPNCTSDGGDRIRGTVTYYEL